MPAQHARRGQHEQARPRLRCAECLDHGRAGRRIFCVRAACLLGGSCAAAQIMNGLVQLLLPVFRAEIAAARHDDWIDQSHSPLGRREHCRLARAGTLPARKVGRRWLVRRSELDAWIEAHAEPTAEPSADGNVDLMAAVRAVARKTAQRRVA